MGQHIQKKTYQQQSEQVVKNINKIVRTSIHNKK